MKKSVNISMAALLAIAMAAVLNVSELKAQVRSSASRSSQGNAQVRQENTRSAARSIQMDNRNGATQNRSSVTQNRMDDRSRLGGQISNKDMAKVDMKPRLTSAGRPAASRCA